MSESYQRSGFPDQDVVIDNVVLIVNTRSSPAFEDVDAAHVTETSDAIAVAAAPAITSARQRSQGA